MARTGFTLQIELDLRVRIRAEILIALIYRIALLMRGCPRVVSGLGRGGGASGCEEQRSDDNFHDTSPCRVGKFLFWRSGHWIWKNLDRYGVLLFKIAQNQLSNSPESRSEVQPRHFRTHHPRQRHDRCPRAPSAPRPLSRRLRSPQDPIECSNPGQARMRSRLYRMECCPPLWGSRPSMLLSEPAAPPSPSRATTRLFPRRPAASPPS
ncbi:MAG: hypothetical protein QOI40_5638, partial [Alphaproteobacteria bacterium]|nr:hypothetical protein [Alphaproteobacteria bacterium]